MMDPRFRELCENRKAYVQIAKRNGFYEGLKQLLTQLYPERAHFIFELLQNAEDAGASEVQFRLNQDYLEFEHDGKRLFNYSDVEAITGISQSTKKDNGTAIGKFGIGFKSIYAYTSMPEIYSGDYRFSISESFIPLPIRSARQIEHEKTLFIMPFDNPDKDAAKAFSEITEALKSLNFSSVLFLKNINVIKYSLGEGLNGIITKNEEGPYTRISWSDPAGEMNSRIFLRFQKDVEIEDDNGIRKVCNIGIAYKVQYSGSKKKQNELTIVPMNRGVVSIYFPAVKETSNLKFNMNAPFASTVARDSVRSCVGNDRLRDALAELAVESIRTVRDLGLLNMGFLACLPNEKDELPPFYEPIRQKIIQAFREESLTPLRKGGYAPARILLRAPAKISEVFPDAQFAKIMGFDDDRVWAANAPQRNQREDNFLESLGMPEWSWSQLASLIKNCDKARNATGYYTTYEEKLREKYLPSAKFLEEIIASFCDDWVYSFYALLGEGITQHDISLSCDNLKFIRTKDKDSIGHVIPSEAHLPADEMKMADSGVLYVKDEAYKKQKREKENSYVLAFLQDAGVREYDIHERLRLRLEPYKSQQQPVDETAHIEDMRLFSQYVRQGGDLDLFNEAYFILGTRKGKKTGAIHLK